MSDILRNAIRRRAVSSIPNAPLGDQNAPLVNGYRQGHIIEQVGLRDRRAERTRISAGYIHATALSSMCPRQFQIANILDHESFSRVTGGHRVMWAIGHALESHVRNSYVEAVGGAGVWGKWACDCGYRIVDGLFPLASRICSHCRTRPRWYREYTLVDDYHGVTGNPDFVLIANGTMLVVEIKSMKADQFNGLGRPLADHVFQASVYRKLFLNLGYTVSNSVVLFYVSKDFKHGQPYKEFEIDVSGSVHNALIDGLLEAAKAVKDNTTEINLTRCCSRPTESRAKKCPVVGPCFNQR